MKTLTSIRDTVLGCLVLTVACALLGMVVRFFQDDEAVQNEPESVAVVDQDGSARTAEPPKPATQTLAPTNTVALTDTPLPTHTQPPTNTPIPTNTPVPTDTPPPTLTPSLTPIPIINGVMREWYELDDLNVRINGFFLFGQRWERDSGEVFVTEGEFVSLAFAMDNNGFSMMPFSMPVLMSGGQAYQPIFGLDDAEVQCGADVEIEPFESVLCAFGYDLPVLDSAEVIVVNPLTGTKLVVPVP